MAMTPEMTPEKQRVCFLLQLKPDRVQDYLAAHEHVWAEMLAALREAGWHNYSLFLRPEDGLVVGYLETPDFAAAQQAMAATEINAKWQAGMAEYFQDNDRYFQDNDTTGARPDQSMRPLQHYFHLA